MKQCALVIQKKLHLFYLNSNNKLIVIDLLLIRYEMNLIKNKKNLSFWKSKENIEVGLDECARGCLLGRTYTAAVIWNPEFLEEVVEDEDFTWIHKINDSKKISAKNREFLSEKIKEYCLDYSITWADEKIIDQKNILQAVQGCFHMCLDSLQITPNHIY